MIVFTKATALRVNAQNRLTRKTYNSYSHHEVRNAVVYFYIYINYYSKFAS